MHLTWRVPGYWAWLVWQIMASAVDVSRRVISPRLPIDPVLERLPTSQKTDVGRAIYANSITLTPGTVSTDLRDDMVQVHALTSGAMERLRQGEMDARVTSLEGES
jgi:multicomponent Na+:H+ antiporter subunit E